MVLNFLAKKGLGLLGKKAITKIPNTISNVKGKYNIGNASKIKNKASKANLEKVTLEVNQAAKKFKEAVEKLGTKK